jgi:chitin synthase
LALLPAPPVLTHPAGTAAPPSPVRRAMAAAAADLVSLVSATAQTTVYPSDDAVLSFLQQRFRVELPYTRLGASTLVVLNPLRTLANLSDASADAYRKAYAEAAWEAAGEQHPDEKLPPHPYEFAARVYHYMRRTAQSQAIVFSGATNAGKTYTSKLVTAQLLRLASQGSKREAKLAEQVRAFDVLLNAFGAAKTKSNGNASRHGRYLELHYSEQGRLAAAKVLTFGLDKDRLCAPLAPEERTYHVFYQLLAGATQDEREALRLEDVTSYALLASSGCYRLSGGPSSDDGIAMDELRAAMRTLGFKPKHFAAIFALLSAILCLGSLTFADPEGHDQLAEAAHITSAGALEDAAALLGVSEDDLEQCLTTRVRFVRKEQVSSFLDASAAAVQRDSLARDLYATLFAYVVETANHRVCPGPDERHATQIVQLDVAGYQSRAGSSLAAPPPGGAQASAHWEFAGANFVSEVVQNFLVRQAFDNDTPANAELLADGLSLPDIVTGDNTACVELLRGSRSLGGPADRKPAGVLGSLDKAVHRVRTGKAKEDDDAALLTELDQHGAHGSYVASTSSNMSSAQGPRRVFGINHYQGQCSYDVRAFVSREMDVFDSSFVQMLRRSQVSFVAKLFAGPSLATEAHPLDANIVVNAQVSVRPLRQPTPLHPAAPLAEPLLDAQKVYGVSRQLNAALSEILSTLQHAGKVWTVLAMRPNDIDQPNSFDGRRVKAQLRSLLLPDLVARKRHDYATGLSFAEFCQRYADSVSPAAAAAGVSEPREKIQAFAIGNAWRDGQDYALGQSRVWLAYGPWRRLEDRLRASEPADLQVDVDDRADAMTERSGMSPSYPPGGMGRSTSYLNPSTPMGGDGDLGKGGFGESEDQLLLRRPSNVSNPFTGGADSVKEAGAWGSEWDKGAYGGVANPGIVGTLEKSGDLEGKAIDAVTEEPVTAVRRWWVRLAWAFTWWIPSFVLSRCGGMKRPDVQMAWREKVTICGLIALFCGVVLFWILGFGAIICPGTKTLYNAAQLGEHNTAKSYYTAIRGEVYDLSKWAGGRHAAGVTSDVMTELAGQDLTPYFPIPLNVGCPNLVTDPTVALQTNGSSTYYSAAFTQAIHLSGPSAPDQASTLANAQWYPNTLLPFLRKYYHGTFVVASKAVRDQATDRNWAVVNGRIYDLGNYIYTKSLTSTVSSSPTLFLPESVSSLWENQPGQDITSDFNSAMGSLNTTTRRATQQCLDNIFYIGQTDKRETARCQVNNYLLLAFSCLIMATLLAKFLAALQLAPKRNPEQQDKFVICQV